MTPSIEVPIRTFRLAGGKWAASGELLVDGALVRRDVKRPHAEAATYIIFKLDRTEEGAREKANKDIPFIIAMARREGKIS